MSTIGVKLNPGRPRGKLSDLEKGLSRIIPAKGNHKSTCEGEKETNISGTNRRD